MNDKNLFKEIKNHIENWKIGCKYKIPFDYVGLRLVLRRNYNNMKRPKIKDFFQEKTDLETVHSEYTKSPHLYSYSSALDGYIDYLEDQLKT